MFGIADLWFRRGTEFFPDDPRRWELNDDRCWLRFSLAFGVINVAHVLIGIAGLWRSHAFFGIGLLVLFLLLCSLVLGTRENP